MPRYVLLHHECPPEYIKPTHWDLMLEVDGVLWTWELRELPLAWQMTEGETGSGLHEKVTTFRLADHRIAYLDYEGPLSANRGEVRRVARGEYEFIENSSERIVVRLGKPLSSDIELAVSNEHQDRWQLIVRP